MNASQIKFEAARDCECCVLVVMENMRHTDAPRVVLHRMMYPLQGQVIGMPPRNERAAQHLNEAAALLNVQLQRLAGDSV